MNFKKGFLFHLLPLLIFFLITSIFFAPLYTGKVLVQSDNIQLSGSSKEVADYREKGEEISWTNREFSGLPVLSGSEYNLFVYINRALFGGFIPKIIMMVFALFVGFYILLQVLGVSRWLSAIGALAFAYSTFNIISIEAGHDNKVLAMAFMAPVLAGVIMAYSGKYLKGALLTCLAAGLQLLYGHIQITYYLLIMVLAYLIVVIYQTWKSGKWNEFVKASLYLMGGALIAIGCNFGKLYSTVEYSDYSTRGGSELASDKASGDGLDKDYAWSWSNGVLETFTVMFPYFHGGATGEALSEDSDTYKELRSHGVDNQTINGVTSRVALYWGDQPFTAGPLYFGIIIIFLFVLSFFLLDGPFKWWGIGLTLLAFLLAMGKNLEWFNNFFFYYVPLYNKFRSVTMSFSIAQLLVPLLGIMALDKLLKENSGNKIVTNRILQSAGILIGLALIFLLFKNSLFDFKGINDAQYFSQFPEWLKNAIISDRKSKFNGDIIRGILFLVLMGGGTWLLVTRKLKENYFLIGLAVLVLIDLLGVNRRYVSTDDFDSPNSYRRNAFQPTQADQTILQDDSYYRVFNTTRRLDQDGMTSYHHFSIGGYNAIKMQRYQELIERQISQGNRGVLNMLNVKYFITAGENGPPMAQRNPQALGNAWAVEDLKIVENADEEINSLNEIDPGVTALVDERFSDYIEGSTTFSGKADINLESYHPEEMKYHFNSDENQFVVFSEIYYKPGWNAYIDGNEEDHIRVDYVLRGLKVPAGDHEIIFKYEPVSEVVGNWLAIISSILILVFLGIEGFSMYRSHKVA
ncbi:MAG: YfhO family protein [Bacteroidota bacterium]